MVTYKFMPGTFYSRMAAQAAVFVGVVGVVATCDPCLSEVLTPRTCVMSCVRWAHLVSISTCDMVTQLGEEPAGYQLVLT
jgi:hypothetical protein